MDPTLIDQIPATIRAISNAWEQPLARMGFNLLAWLIGIELAWATASLALRRASIEEWAAQVVWQIMFAGIFTWLLLNANWIAAAVIDSFRDAAGIATGFGRGLRPSDLLAMGGNLSLAIAQRASIFNPTDSLAMLLSALIIVVCFATMAALMVVRLVESFLVVAAMPLFLGFGGSRWTKEVALSAARYCISVGAALFALILISGVLKSIAAQWVSNFDAGTAQSTDVMVGLSIMCAWLTFSIPSLVQSFVNGSSLTGGAGLMAAAGTFSAGASMALGSLSGGLKSASGGIAAGAQAVNLAAAQHTDTSLTGAAKIASIASGAVGNLGRAVGGSVAGKLSGRGPITGSTLWDAASSMRDTARQHRADQAKPKEKASNKQ